mgnify:CR=1 FL=1
MKYWKLLPIGMLMMTCSAEELVDNQALRAAIDQLPVSQVITKVEMDATGNILDTLLVEYRKLDEQRRLQFKKRVNWHTYGKTTDAYYFTSDEETFYVQSFDRNGQLYSTFEAWSNPEGEVEKAITISLDREPADTVLMDYTRTYHSNGAVKHLLIVATHKEVEESLSTTSYDNQRYPITECLVVAGDTATYQNWEYADGILQKSTYNSYRGDTSRYIYHYGEGERLDREVTLKWREGEYQPSEEVRHFYDKDGEKTRSIELNLSTAETKYFNYLPSRIAQ